MKYAPDGSILISMGEGGVSGFYAPDGSMRVTVVSSSGDTASRPVSASVGFQYFDSDLGIPIYWNGTDWVDSTGADPDV